MGTNEPVVEMTSEQWIHKLRAIRGLLVEDYQSFVDHIKALEHVTDILENEDEVESVLTAECLLLKAKMEKMLEALDG